MILVRNGPVPPRQSRPRDSSSPIVGSSDPKPDPLRALYERRSDRIALNAEISLRRPGRPHYRVRVYDASLHGCKVEFVERPSLDEHVWLKFEGLDAIEGLVCWIDGFVAGIEFVRPIHPAVFERLVPTLR
jgi:PilZ domain-containing protein